VVVYFVRFVHVHQTTPFKFETEDAALRAVEAVGATAEIWIMAGHRARRVISLSSLSGARYH
jgi:hypothetical protein